MAFMRVVKTTIHQIAYVAAMRDGFMTAAGAMHMIGLMAEAIVGDWGASVRVLCRYFDLVLVHMTFVGMMQMPIMQVVDVIAVANGRVAAAGSMHMRMIVVLRVRTAHNILLFPRRSLTALRSSSASLCSSQGVGSAAAPSPEVESGSARPVKRA